MNKEFKSVLSIRQASRKLVGAKVFTFRSLSLSLYISLFLSFSLSDTHTLAISISLFISLPFFSLSLICSQQSDMNWSTIVMGKVGETTKNVNRANILSLEGGVSSLTNPVSDSTGRGRSGKRSASSISSHRRTDRR